MIMALVIAALVVPPVPQGHLVNCARRGPRLPDWLAFAPPMRHQAATRGQTRGVA